MKTTVILAITALSILTFSSCTTSSEYNHDHGFLSPAHPTINDNRCIDTSEAERDVVGVTLVRYEF